MPDKIYISADGEVREATEEEIASITEAQANAIETRSADSAGPE